MLVDPELLEGTFTTFTRGNLFHSTKSCCKVFGDFLLLDGSSRGRFQGQRLMLALSPYKGLSRPDFLRSPKISRSPAGNLHVGLA